MDNLLEQITSSISVINEAIRQLDKKIENSVKEQASENPESEKSDQNRSED